MLAFFDWIRQCRTGGELLALLSGEIPERSLGLSRKYRPPPPSGLFRVPCERCGFFPASPENRSPRCAVCQEIHRAGNEFQRTAGFARALWGHVNRIPRMLSGKKPAESPLVLGLHVHDEHHFLAMFPTRRTLDFFQRLMLYDGHDLKGFLQIFPTVSRNHRNRMSDLLIRAGHYDGLFPMDALRIRCFTKAHQLFNPGKFDTGDGRITFDAADFMSLLEMARICRRLLNPLEQDMVRNYAESAERRGTEESFAWGRMTASLSPEARDMLIAWDFRNWPLERSRYFFDLFAYVDHTA